MGQKIKLDNKEYLVENLSDEAKANLELLKFVTAKVKELQDMKAVLQRSKNSYISSLKTEMLSQKAGYLIND